jgi:fatty acid desaturase|tara:strand:+ start:93 stop:896 length:804 start_codon:yes stop_codon:yes gene_type:complete
MKLKIDHTIQVLEYPTVLLTVLGYLFWLTAIYLRLEKDVHSMFTVPLSTLGVYTLFTPLHEAVHKNISSNKIINNIIGNIVIVPYFFANFETFKYIHLQHHTYTNKPLLDPDRFSRFGIISCICMPLHYYKYYVTKMYKDNLVRSNIVYMVIIYSFIYISYLVSLFNHLFILWIAPSILGIGILAYLFDYLPHRDHTDTVQHTTMTDGCLNLNNGKGNDIISFLTCNQLTYHHIHHLQTRIPFYKYKSISENNYKALQHTIKKQTMF